MTKNFKILSGSMLKLIAVISMLIDHTAHALRTVLPFMKISLFSFRGTNYTIYYLMRLCGRLAFPIFCFLIVEGFLHTKNVKKYCLRLAIFAAVSEIPFNFMLSGKIYDLSHQNVYFTLLLGVLALWTYERLDNHLYRFLAVGFLALLGHILHTDYGMEGVILILTIYILKNTPSLQMIISYLVLKPTARLFAWAAFIPINMYNGERGFIKSKGMKFAFYVFYPVHIAVLVAIKFILK